MVHDLWSRLADPTVVMDPRNLGAMQPHRLSASRSFMSKMIREGWRIEREVFELDRSGNGRARYSVSTPGGSLTFIAFMREPSGKNRTGRIIGTSWDMIGALIDGVATHEQVERTAQEMPRLYEGRATSGTLVWFRSNQSLRIFQDVRHALASGQQPDPKDLRRVGYLMRNTGLDGNGTFGTIPFAALPENHPLAVSYHAQMLSAYLMRELSVDLVEELAHLDAPHTAVRLDPSIKRLIGVGNGSALGLAMLFYNRPILVHSYISAYLSVVEQVLTDATLSSPKNLAILENHLARTIAYRSFLKTTYRFFTSNMEIAADLRRIRAKVRAAIRGEVHPSHGTTVLAAIHRQASRQVSKEALHSFNTLLMELAPESLIRVAADQLRFDERLDLDPRTPLSEVRSALVAHYRWALDLPLNHPEHRDRVWYQSRAAEEPRSGPREEVPDAHELIQSYPDAARRLLQEIDAAEDNACVGDLIFAHPDLEYITRLVLSLRDKPYAIAHADPHDAEFVPVWLIRFVNSFVHGLDRTEDYMGRDVRGIIFEGAPFRDEIQDADGATWWWSYQPTAPSHQISPPSSDNSVNSSGPAVSRQVLTPVQTPITPPARHATETIDMKFREIRLMAGRAYQALNVPDGSWHGARELFVVSLVADLRAAQSFGRLLLRDIDAETGQAPKWAPPGLDHHKGGLIVDNQGQSLLVTGHVIVCLLGAKATRHGRAFKMTNLAVDHCLPGLQLELARYGVDLRAEEQGGEVVGTIHLAEDPEPLRRRHQSALTDFLVHGRTIPADTFWNIYYRANAGLDIDTPISRQHTGGTVLDVIRPGERITKQFTSEELHLLIDPDELDNQNILDLIQTR